MARDALVVPDRDQVPEREAGPARASAARCGPGREKSCDGPRVVRRRGAAGRRDHRLDPAHRLGEVEVRAVQRGDRLVHHRLQPLADLLDALDGRAVLVQPAHGLHRRRAGQDLLGLDAAARPGSAGARPSPRRRPPRGPGPGAEVRAGPAAHGQRVALAADGVRRPLGARARTRRAGSRGSRRPPRRRRARRRRSSARSASGPVATKRGEVRPGQPLVELRDDGARPGAGRRAARGARPPRASRGSPR